MNKFGNIILAVIVSSFLAVNFYLLFNKNSTISKSVYVSEFERMTADDFTEEMPKEALVSPMDLYTVYVGSENEVESWLIAEGDSVSIGDELALLNTERTDGELELLEAESTALLQQKTDLQKLITDLSTAQSTTSTDSSSTVDRNENVTEVDGETNIRLDLGIGFTVDVTQEGSYTQAISAAEQQLTEITQQLAVLDAKLAQDSSHPAIISPVDGIVSELTRQGPQLAVDIYSSEKIVVTYAKDDEWQQIEEGDRVLLQGTGLEEVVEGTVLSVSTIPATNNETIETYKTVDPKDATNPLAYYEVQISTENEFQTIPYGSNVNAIVILDEAKGAVAVNEDWIRRLEEDFAKGTIIDSSGRAVEVTMKTPFQLHTRAVVTEGLSSGQIVIHQARDYQYEDAPKVFLQIPSNIPSKKEWKTLGWKKFLEYMILK